ncbi:hypothetical protein [Methanosarcina sp.]|uniref:hypothetical protein n=1 Tax=Methanosarcina sp. TaxID=2213 RepID=UPI003C75A898
MIIMLLIILLTFSAGCTEGQSGTSEDATITHKTYGGFTVPEMQLQELTVNSTSVVFTTSDMEGRFKQVYEKPFNETDFEELVGLFERNGFFEMQDRYTPQEGQPVVTDVGIVEISLTEENRAKTVTVDPYYSEYMPEGLQEIDSALLELRAYAVSTSPEEAEKIAAAWIENAPTYSFDGFDLKLEDHEVLDAIPEQHFLTYTFTSRHGGYGNRTGQIVTEALTPHRIEITISDRNITSAIIDGEWDEFAQKPVEKAPEDFENTTWTEGNLKEEAEGNLTEIKYRIPEGKTPWDQWYEEGNIRFIKAPSQPELIIAYYGTVYNIEVFDVKRVEGCDLYYSGDGFFYTAKVRENDFAKMKDLGWTAKGEY